jgi:DNA polymerase-3 subunit epsilon
MDFVCIDFETANRNYASVCAVALIFFKDNEIVTTKEWLIQPHESFREFDKYNVKIHGITEDDVAGAPEFDDVWDEILELIDHQYVIAHNASFDMKVLRRLLNLYDLEYPSFYFICTYILSSKTWDNMINYKLINIAKMLGYDFNHHDPHDDAKTAGKIFIEACHYHDINSMDELYHIVGIDFGIFTEDTYQDCHADDTYKGLSRGSERFIMSDLIAASSEFNTRHALYNKTVAFTGTLVSMPRKEAMQIVVDVGGVPRTTVSTNTNYLVMGLQDYSQFVDGKESSKTKKAKQLIEKGKKLQIIDEDTFLRLL